MKNRDRLLPGMTEEEEYSEFDNAPPQQMDVLGDVPFSTAQNKEISLEESPARQVITHKDISRGIDLLREYKAGKTNLEERVVEDEKWWKLQHQQLISDKEDPRPKSTSAYLFSMITGKHADAMDNFPEPIVQPRERSDEESAKTLSSIIPTLMEYNDFESEYSDNWWEKLKHGTSIYGVFWNPKKENGLGEIEIKGVDLLKIFYEPGIKKIQESKNVFITDLVDIEELDLQYPELAGKFGSNAIDVKQYEYDDTVDTSKKAVVVDWYYKKTVDGMTKLHYIKFCGEELLYASENDPEYAERGFYDHGMYPLVFDTLFPEKGSPVGFGYVSVNRNPQMFIDTLYTNILESSKMGTRKRFFASTSTGIDMDEFLDWTNPIVHIEGELGEERLREIVVQPIAPIYQSILQMKIEEMKETSASRDINNGSGAGITAASAIAALQEAGNKNSRDILAASYRAYREIIKIVVELIRQFYDETRSFRITGELPGEFDFVDINNQALVDQSIGMGADGQELFRTPIFDIKIKAQKKSPFSRMEENERAKELYGMGFFNPERAQEALGALEMMDFEGIEKVKDNISQGQTLLNIVQQLQMQVQELTNVIGTLTGVPPMGSQPIESGAGGQMQMSGSSAGPAKSAGNGNSLASGIMEANTPMTSYGQRLAKRSTPDMNSTGNIGAI